MRPSSPCIFTLERRAESSGPYRPWAIAVIALGASSVALRLKSPEGAAHTRVDRFPLEPGGAERFFFEDLPQLGRSGAEVTRNTPSVHFVMTEIQKAFNAGGIAVFRGRAGRPHRDDVAPDERIQDAAAQEFSARSIDMLPTEEDAFPRA
jgi:hypothetical protein